MHQLFIIPCTHLSTPHSRFSSGVNNSAPSIRFTFNIPPLAFKTLILPHLSSLK